MTKFGILRLCGVHASHPSGGREPSGIRERIETPRRGRVRVARQPSDGGGETQGGSLIVAASSREKEIVEEKLSSKIDIASIVGKRIGSLAKKVGVSQVKFDRGGYLYHGRIKSLAEGAREGGLKF